MSRDLRVLATAASVVASAAALALAALLLLGAWPAEQRALLAHWAAQRAPLLVLAALAALGASAAVAWQLLARRVGFVPHLVHDLGLLRSGRPGLRVREDTGVPVTLAAAVNAVADDHARLQRRADDQIALATQQLADERDLLAAVLTDVPAAVLACSRDGRVLLYTPRAAALVQQIAPETFLGLGRTVFTLFRRSAIVHGLERMDSAQQRGEARPAVAALLTTRGGALVHARFTPLQGRSLSGFFLHLQTSDVASTSDSGADGERRRLTNLRAAVEVLRDFPQMSATERARFVAVADEESARLAQRLGGEDEPRWPLEDIAAETLLPLLQAQLQAGLLHDVKLAPQPQLWVAAEILALAAVLRGYCSRFGADAMRSVRLELHDTPRYAQLVLRWQPPQLLPAADWAAWEQAPLAEQGLQLSPAEVARGHGGELWQQLDGDSAVLRVLLPRAEPAATDGGAAPARVEITTAAAADTDGGTALAAQIFTAFDTETTGLDPAGGDEIIAIGGIRIVDGRILSREVFETLVASTRRIDPAAQRVHGIDASMLAGQPPVTEALRRFGSFCEDTVLIGHNVAFDLRFIELQGAAAGLSLAQPVLDTLLLSQFLYPQADSHQLEAIATRLGVSVIGRHTALGDAILTAEVFLRLLPLLAARGVHTLAQAQTAAASTPLSGLRY